MICCLKIGMVGTCLFFKRTKYVGIILLLISFQMIEVYVCDDLPSG